MGVALSGLWAPVSLKGPKVLSMLRDVFYGCEKILEHVLVFLFIHILKTVYLQQLFSICSVFSVLFSGIYYIIPHSIIHCLKSWWRL